jgi:hypothetical protein
MTGAICWLSAARLACMFCTIGSDAAAAEFAAVIEGGALVAVVAGGIAASGAAPLLATAGAEDAADGAASSGPQPLNTKVASATKATLARPMSLLMSASSFVKADAVSNPFEK